MTTEVTITAGYIAPGKAVRIAIGVVPGWALLTETGESFRGHVYEGQTYLIEEIDGVPDPEKVDG